MPHAVGNGKSDNAIVFVASVGGFLGKAIDRPLDEISIPPALSQKRYYHPAGTPSDRLNNQPIEPITHPRVKPSIKNIPKIRNILRGP